MTLPSLSATGFGLDLSYQGKKTLMHILPLAANPRAKWKKEKKSYLNSDEVELRGEKW